jgi:hypothetical protein
MAHSIIPHHHCDDMTAISTSCSQWPDENSPHQGKIPWHCQAVNHLVLIEQQLSIKFKAFQLFHFDMVLTHDVYEITLAEQIILHYPLLCDHSFNKPFLSHQVLRGPPSIA